MLKENEQFEDLEIGGLKIIQSKSGYRFTSDAVILANFVRALPNQKIVDLGSGSGVIGIHCRQNQSNNDIFGGDTTKAC